MVLSMSVKSLMLVRIGSCVFPAAAAAAAVGADDAGANSDVVGILTLA